MNSEFISFPKLGWTFNVSPTIVEFDLFGQTFSINWYGLLIAIGFLLAVIYALRRAKDFDIDPDRMIDVVLVSAIFAFIGARLYYVLFSAERAQYFEDPLSILYVWNGGLAIYGGILFAFITALWMCRLRKVNTLAMFDLASLGFLIGQCIGRWGNFFNQEAFGGNTELPWGMTGSIIQSGATANADATYIHSLPVHPTFLYESLWCLLGFLILHFVSKKAYKFKGEIFALYIMWYGAGRAFIEGLRTDSLYFGAMRVSQMLAVLSVLGGLVLFLVFRARAKALPKTLFETSGAELTAADEAAAGEGELLESGETEEPSSPDNPDADDPVDLPPEEAASESPADENEAGGQTSDQPEETEDGISRPTL